MSKIDGMIDVGYGALMGEDWIPEGIMTGIKDINGVEIKTRDKVKITGCTSQHAIVGIDKMKGLPWEYMLYFGSEEGYSVGWKLTEKVVIKNKVQVR